MKNKKYCSYDEFKRAIKRNYSKLKVINYCNGVWFFATNKCIFCYKPVDDCEEIVFMVFCRNNYLMLSKKDEC